jgi:hypothetical protein
MTDDGAYVPQPADMVTFERPPANEGARKLFRIASHDAQTGMTSLTGRRPKLTTPGWQYREELFR